MGLQLFSQNIGIVQASRGLLTVALTPTTIAPSKVSILPSRTAPAPRPTAPIFANKVPFILASAATEIAPSAIKKTLLDFVPPLKLTTAPAPTVIAP